MKYLEKIEQYLNADLSAADRQTFERNCAENEELARELAFYLQTQHTIRLTQQKALIQQYKLRQTQKAATFRGRIKSILPTFSFDTLRQNWQLQLSMAVAVVAIVLGGWWLMSSTELPNTYNDLAITQDKLDTTDFIRLKNTMGSPTKNLDSLVLTALEAGALKNYEQGLRIINEIADSNYFEVLEIKGLYNYRVGNYQQAIATFEKYLDENQVNGNYKMLARWYQALAYLHLEQPIKAKKNLETIVTTGTGQLPKRAQKLLEIIEKKTEETSNN